EHGSISQCPIPSLFARPRGAAAGRGSRERRRAQRVHGRGRARSRARRRELLRLPVDVLRRAHRLLREWRLVLPVGQPLVPLPASACGPRAPPLGAPLSAALRPRRRPALASVALAESRSRAYGCATSTSLR